MEFMCDARTIPTHLGKFYLTGAQGFFMDDNVGEMKDKVFVQVKNTIIVDSKIRQGRRRCCEVRSNVAEMKDKVFMQVKNTITVDARSGKGPRRCCEVRY